MDYFDYDRDAVITCDCGWSGTAFGNEQYYRDLIEVVCPQCGSSLLIVALPTIAETREAAAQGNQRAVENLPMVEVIETRLKQAKELALSDPGQLPDLDGSDLRIDWDFDERQDEKWTVLRHDGVELWRELAFWEGDERFAEVFAILRARYGARLAEVRPTEAAKLYLYGDRLGSPQIIKDLNAGLRPT